MKSQLLKIPVGPDYSFSIRQDKVPGVNNRLHYHPEIELIHFKSGRGVQYVGDSVSRFSAGDVVLVGSNLSHCWRFDSDLTDHIDVRVAHFCENFWGDDFLDLPENRLIKRTLEKAGRGIQVSGKHREKVKDLLEESLHSEGSRRIILLMEILTLISRCRQQMLASPGFRLNADELCEERLNRVFEYTHANFRKKISLKEIAEVANMSENSFCRYFKSKTRKTFIRFLNEIRIGHACKLLMENNMSIKQIYYESGFNNVTSFHKYFKGITGKSPLHYQQQFLANDREYAVGVGNS
ncbi:AraC family transcriptional regulator [Sinomicrobium weinanense]|uniref:Helix-turn-helix transcriptional regulator n=1 Tax=Sinomicrobium weinanense TaxID=2842200 RepID=A0A926JTG4_9FLAO|nr:AraC family transcriptional regulator [Sinomicrobium weinanense]MBC9797203.1 helix-turn-helix transcriptional regulator [Sinomicrobium weinanense]MBU3122733.1 AraC family transcriptional regulator [Sinomicrobium weinanense]